MSKSRVEDKKREEEREEPKKSSGSILKAVAVIVVIFFIAMTIYAIIELCIPAGDEGESSVVIASESLISEIYDA